MRTISVLGLLMALAACTPTQQTAATSAAINGAICIMTVAPAVRDAASTDASDVHKALAAALAAGTAIQQTQSCPDAIAAVQVAVAAGRAAAVTVVP